MGLGLSAGNPRRRTYRWKGRSLRLAFSGAVLCLLFLAPGSVAGTVPTGFQDSAVITGLSFPTVLRFAPDGRVFVAQKNGVIKVFDNLSDASPDTFADLSGEVHNFWDRGLLGMALDPGFTTGQPYVYVLYTYGVPLGGGSPTYGDSCPTPPGPTTDGCVVSARLSRLTASGNFMTGSEQVLVADWCQQFPSHSVGTLAFGPDGKLYVSGGDGASFNAVDYGQFGNTYTGDQPNPCGDPPAGVGGVESPPTAEGGALRSQDLRTTTDPASLDGSILRLDPDTGLGAAGNPLSGSTDPNVRRIVAQGLRNPFRFTFRPGTNELWVGDVGWNTWEEVDRLVTPTGTSGADVDNFGWPCYEGAGRQSGYDGANVDMCESLYAAGSGAVASPYYSYNHSAQVVSGETCPTGSSSISGLAFHTGSSYPATYDGALFFADHSRNCIWAMLPGTGGLPNPGNIVTFDAGAAGPVDLEIGPNGDVFYVNYDGGEIRRIQYFPANQPPTARATASPTSGPAPLTATFDGSGSSDPDGDPLTYAWDLDGDGQFDDSTAQKPSYTYPVGTFQARLRVTDSHGSSSTSTPLTISSSNTAPTATLSAPSSTATWGVGDTINFFGAASDPQDGTLPGAALTWTVALEHCPSNCHEHIVQTVTGSSGSFSAPDHDYPSYLELRLTATDSGGLTDTKIVDIQPRTVQLSFQSSPAGLQLTVGSSSSITPFTRTVIEGSNNSVSADSPQDRNGTIYAFGSWSDGGAQTHTIRAASSATYSAAYARAVAPASTAAPAISGSTDVGATLTTSDGSWSGTQPMSFMYQWLRCSSLKLNSCGTIADATAKTYVATSGDVNTRLRVQVTASNVAGSAVATSSATAMVAGSGGSGGGGHGKPTSTAAPAISGVAAVGQTLTTSDGSWSGAQPMMFTYEWLRCSSLKQNSCVTISGATAKTYVATSADAHARLRARVLASNTAGTGTALSAATSFVAE
jgi:glucose/arabinose dehydrogenase